MEMRKFGKTGLEVSALGYGSGPVGYLATDKQQASTILNTLLDRGVNLIDTAAAYMGAEEVIGGAIAARRSEYVLVSKCGRDVDETEDEAWSESVVTFTVDRALKRLETDHLDVMLLHSCDLDTLKKGEAIGALVKARDAGKIRFLGYSGDNDAVAYAVALDDVDVIETSVSICDQANIDLVLAEAERRGVGVLAKRPIANAAWKGADSQQGIYAGYAATYEERLAKMALTPAALGFDGAANDAWPEIALRFTLSMPGVSSAIVGTTNAARIDGNIAAAAKGALAQSTVDEIRSSFQRAESAAGESWLGET